MAEYRRINLCFNIDEEEQKQVYEFLISKGKQKTHAVTKALLPHEVKIDTEEELYRAEMMQRLQYLNDKLDNLVIAQNQNNNFGSSQSFFGNSLIKETRPKHADESIKEMSEDAFSAIAGFIR